MSLKELYSYRELLYYFTWREFKVRYKQTIIGVLWVIFQPLFFTLIINFTLLRGRTFDFGGQDIPTLIPVYIGVVFWNYFEQALNNSSNSLVNNQAVITKVFFPRFIPSAATTLAALIDFCVASIILLALGPILHYNIRYQYLPILLAGVLLVLLFVNGLGILLATLNIRFRDIRIALPFVMRILLFATPVFYPLSFIPQRYHSILFFNPLTSAIEVSRALLLHTGTMPSAIHLAESAFSVVFFLIVGFWYFSKKERVFIDII